MLGFLRTYPSFLVFIGLFIAVVLTLALMPSFIRFLRRESFGQQVRDDGPQTHLKKQGTPTMGGVIMMLSVVVAILIVGIPDAMTVALLVAAVAAGLIGVVDDYKKVHYKNTDGVSPKGKLIFQFLVAGAFVLVAVNELNIAPTLWFPLIGTLDLGFCTTVLPIGDVVIAIPWFYLIFCMILMVGLCNAVNLTDGLDGLASGTVMFVMIVMAMIAYRLNILEPAIFAAAVAGTCAAFLWFNANPADIFMGDAGSLFLGMSLGALAILTKTEVLVILIGGLFVVEALSVMIQVFYFRKTGKRVFLMAPLHHHFEKKGWGENKVVVRFWMISGLLSALGFAIFFAAEIF